MARIVPIKNDDLRSLIALEGRPVNLSVALEGDGSSLQATGTTSASLSYTITAVSSDTNAIVTLGIPDSNLQVGDSITISGATGGGYTGLNGSREIVSVISDNKFSINVNSSGYAGAYDADSATLAFSHINPTYSSISTSSIDIDVGRAVAVTSITITSNGFVMHITKALGEVCFIPSATCLIILRFIPSKSSLVIPGFLGTPAVIIITSEFLVSS